MFAMYFFPLPYVAYMSSVYFNLRWIKVPQGALFCALGNRPSNMVERGGVMLRGSCCGHLCLNDNSRNVALSALGVRGVPEIIWVVRCLYSVKCSLTKAQRGGQLCRVLQKKKKRIKTLRTSIVVSAEALYRIKKKIHQQWMNCFFLICVINFREGQQKVKKKKKELRVPFWDTIAPMTQTLSNKM